ncbi:MAG: RNA polymerase sigma-54 factor, partial [Paramuribaculum sp.]|nr:RNA polymerase sigma-54 factor [Paramuribaculum sp.]
MADDIAMATSAEVTLADVKRVWDVIRQFDPAGIAAIDLRDCLLLQLKRRNANDSVVKHATEILHHYFDLFSKKHYEKILSATGLSSDELSAAIALIRELNPKPGSVATPASDDTRMRHITPDFIVEPDEDGNLQLTAVSSV